MTKPLTISSIKNFKLPILIPKRNKGVNEVFASFDFSVNDFIPAEDFVNKFLPLSKNVASLQTILDIVAEIDDRFKLDDLKLNITFNYHLDRTSPGYIPTTFEMHSFFSINVEKRKITPAMGISIPVRVKEIIPLPGVLSLEILNPKVLFFEDILDHVQKYTGTKLYPKISAAETSLLSSMIDDGKTIKNYLEDLRDSVSNKDLGTGGNVKLVTEDIYGRFHSEYFTVWETSDIRYLTKLKKDNWEGSFADSVASELITELQLSETYRIDVVFYVYSEILLWQTLTDTTTETIRDHGKLVHKMIKQKAKNSLLENLKNRKKING